MHGWIGSETKGMSRMSRGILMSLGDEKIYLSACPPLITSSHPR